MLQRRLAYHFKIFALSNKKQKFTWHYFTQRCLVYRDYLTPYFTQILHVKNCKVIPTRKIGSWPAPTNRSREWSRVGESRVGEWFTQKYFLLTLTPSQTLILCGFPPIAALLHFTLLPKIGDWDTSLALLSPLPYPIGNLLYTFFTLFLLSKTVNPYPNAKTSRGAHARDAEKVKYFFTWHVKCKVSTWQKI